ncbi:hypothetical protein C8N24_4196 [Solirubrobacter pauli]|uniref:Uncharacterized protein n=1 Tax=Solirubrobacter pauli TaxID=166793 RepID=A0A660KX01_9ACTN|nr:hypothetical protein [Solirubrobacter pauli]RKQ86186.1 hypothetical protein C8N24_4196 [Solirubrobacter pauli]
MSRRDDDQGPATSRAGDEHAGGGAPRGSLDALQARLVAASRELTRARRRRARRRGAVCAALIVLVTPPALAATGVWRPTLGDGEGPAPAISADAPPPDQLATLGVLRRAQTEADRGVATRYALKFVDSPSLKGVRTDSIRLLAQSDQDRGVVLVPVERYERRLPGDIPEELRRRVERTIHDALCVYQLDSVDGAGAACYSTADVKEGRAWGMLGHRALWIVPDGVTTVRTEYARRDPIVAPVRDNAAIFTAPEGPAEERRTTWLDADGKAVRVIERALGGATGAPPLAPRAAGATHTGVVTRVGRIGQGLDAGYELVLRMRRPGFYVVLERPACAGKTRVRGFAGTTSREMRMPITPSFGDFGNERWCPGVYRGIVRVPRARKPAGTFSFRVR